MSTSTMPLRLKLQNKFLELMTITTIHGPSRMVSSKHLLHKLAWLILVVTSATYCTIIISNYFQEYFEYPVVTNTDILYDNQPDFPAVMICGHNKERLKKNATISFNSKQIKYQDYFREIDNNCTEFNGG